MRNDLSDFRETPAFVFRNRADAGRRLGTELQALHLLNPLVLGLPRGGVEVGYEVARALHAPLDIMPARKIGAPDQPEVAIGAIAPGAVMFNEGIVEQLALPQWAIAQLIADEEREMARQARIFRAGRPPLDLADKTVVLVDDGLATGATAAAAIESIRQGRPEKLILAVPVGARETVRRLRSEVDELLCLEMPHDFRAVGQWYENFEQTTDARVVNLLRWSSKSPSPAETP